jgi:tRNA-specific 2-thiouridylase
VGADGRRVVVAMSGGVDSSVAALLLSRGFEVVGMTMKIWPGSGCATPGQRSCCSSDAVSGARMVAQQIGIPYYVLDMELEFARCVIDDFVREYRAGRTPNPCVRCNVDLKFGRLLARARAIGASAVATGHYVRLEKAGSPARFRLRAGIDDSKDQSYALWGLTQEQLAAALFPLGELSKVEVRRLARESGLRVAEKPESQDLCFVEKGNYREFLASRSSSPSEGDFVDVEGRVIGRHPGYTSFTIGQRRGLGLATGSRAYVVAIDPRTNRVTLGPADRLACPAFVVRAVNWLSIARPDGPLRCKVKIRYRGHAVPATVVVAGEGSTVTALSEPFRAVTPGQSAVFYDEDGLVLGGGIIEERAP